MVESLTNREATRLPTPKIEEELAVLGQITDTNSMTEYLLNQKPDTAIYIVTGSSQGYKPRDTPIGAYFDKDTKKA